MTGSGSEPTSIVYLGIGSNIGDRESHIRTALEALNGSVGVEVQQVSQLRETEPVGGPEDQGRFLNGAARVATTLSPQAFLGLCRELERRAGRDPDLPRNHPRPLDLDILLFGDLCIDTRELQVPHPRMAGRAFVLEPLADLGVADAKSWVRPRPEVLRTPDAFAAQCSAWAQGSCTIGLVPTMGALHEGHASLLRAARRSCDRVAATIFVNPLQFEASEDLDSYPRTFEADLEVLDGEDVDAVFVPTAATMFPDDATTRVTVGREAETMEGAVRPGHFEGVATVVAKLLAIARPTTLFLGGKDAQQVAVLRRTVTDLGFPVEVRECPTIRERDGLAFSSRNVHLSTEERAVAPTLFRALDGARSAFEAGERDADALLAQARAVIESEPGLEIDYLELRREGDLAPLPPGPMADGRMLVAARLGAVRLLDNLPLSGPPAESVTA